MPKKHHLASKPNPCGADQLSSLRCSSIDGWKAPLSPCVGLIGNGNLVKNYILLQEKLEGLVEKMSPIVT